MLFLCYSIHTYTEVLVLSVEISYSDSSFPQSVGETMPAPSPGLLNRFLCRQELYSMQHCNQQHQECCNWGNMQPPPCHLQTQNPRFQENLLMQVTQGLWEDLPLFSPWVLMQAESRKQMCQQAEGCENSCVQYMCAGRHPVKPGIII